MIRVPYSEKYARDDENYEVAVQRLQQISAKAIYVGAQEAVHLVGGYMEDVTRRGWQFLPEANMIVR